MWLSLTPIHSVPAASVWLDTCVCGVVSGFASVSFWASFPWNWNFAVRLVISQRFSGCWSISKRLQRHANVQREDIRCAPLRVFFLGASDLSVAYAWHCIHLASGCRLFKILTDFKWNCIKFNFPNFCFLHFNFFYILFFDTFYAILLSVCY